MIRGTLTGAVPLVLHGVLLERPHAMPGYDLKEEDLSTMQLYLWGVAPKVRERIDLERLRMGNIAVAAYLTHLVNDWLGQPMGLKFRGDAQTNAESRDAAASAMDTASAGVPRVGETATPAP